MTLTVRATARLQLDEQTALDVGTAKFNPDYPKVIALATGTAANQADLLFTDIRTLTASATESLDLAGGLTSALGATLTFARVKGLYVEADAGNTNDVVLGGAVSNAWVGPFGATSNQVKVKPGGFVWFMAPGTTAYPVTATTADLLQVANSAGTTGVTYRIFIIGASA